MTRASVVAVGGGGCALLRGDPDCRCAAEIDRLSDREIAARATEKSRWHQRSDGPARAAAVLGLDRLLVRSRSSRPTTLQCELLRSAIIMRLLDGGPTAAEEAAALVRECTELAERDGDLRLLGEAATLRAHHTAVFGDDMDALPDAGCALDLLTDAERPPAGADPAEWARLQSRSLNGLVLLLLVLGAHELADEVSRRAIRLTAEHCPPGDRAVHQLNRTRLQLAWALRLERVGQDVEAARRFSEAARTARAAGRLWAAVFGRAPGEAPLPADECSVIGAALALQEPGPQHLPRLAGLRTEARFDHDRIVLAIATARCLQAGGRSADAADALGPLHAELHGSPDEPALALALHREYARMAARSATAGPDPLARYTAALERELWVTRGARISALRGHREHHRLAREHGAIAAQALQDPLTGLPNRRALDLMLEQVTTGGHAPCAVALIDLDGFKAINDAQSHAAGDAVLREVAGCLRASLRVQDMVARYGGDEFVVVLPGTALPVATEVLRRAAAAVSALPAERGAGVSISVGVVRLRPGDCASEAMAGADAAMYRAKRGGGNTVASGPGPAATIPAAPFPSAAIPVPRPAVGTGNAGRAGRVGARGHHPGRRPGGRGEDRGETPGPARGPTPGEGHGEGPDRS